MNVEELIKKKKAEIAEELKITAIEKLEKFTAELKTAIDINPIGAADLPRVIEKGGFVHQEVVDVQRLRGVVELSPWTFLEELASKSFGGHRSLTGKQRVTIIIEPLEE